MNSLLRRFLILAILFLSTAAVGQCFITQFNVTIGACDSTNSFTVNGSFEYVNNPGTGNIIVEATNGAGTYSQTFSPPFTDLTLTNFSISGIPSNGTALTVTVYFSVNSSCSTTINSPSPASCACGAQIGTLTLSTTGFMQGDTTVLQCNDTISIIPNGDFIPPNEAFSPPGPTYDPGIMWLIYSCPPTLGLIPDPANSILMDSCLLGVYTTNQLIDANFGNSPITIWGESTFTDNVVYYMPVTAYSLSSYIYSYTNTTIPCYQVGPIYPVRYLSDPFGLQDENCTNGTATIFLSGGVEEFYGGNYYLSNLLPLTASLSADSVAFGDSVVISGLSIGEFYSFDVSGSCDPVVGLFGTSQDPLFLYPATNVCNNQGILTPVVNADSTGVFSTSSTLIFDTMTGVIDLAANPPGNYDVTLTEGGTCNYTMTDTIRIFPVINTSISLFACDSLISPAGNNYSSSGIYIDTLSTMNGCDSIITIDLTVYPSYTDTSFIVACDSFVSPAGNVFSTTGLHIDTLSSINGCDSIVTFDLVIYPSYTSIASAVVCDSFVSVLGNVYMSSGIYNDTLATINGCDSIISIDLTVNYSTNSYLIAQSCGPYTSPAGIIYDTSGVYVDVIQNAAGCDSVITIDITIITIYSSITVVDATLNADLTGADTYQWFECATNTAINGATSSSYAPPSNGFYKVELSLGSCSETSVCTEVTTVGMEELSFSDLFIYPNPAKNGETTIFYDGTILNIEVLDLLGRVVEVPTNLSTGRIQTIGLNSGKYFVQVVTESGIFIRQLHVSGL